MTDISWQIPPSVLHTITAAPTDRAVAVLLRHSVRDELPPGDAAYVLPITEVGRDLARKLGERLGARLKSLHTSPLVRCVQTAEELARGAGRELPVTPNRLLGDPGAFVMDGARAWPNWERLGHAGVMKHLVSEAQALPGMARPTEAARFLVQSMLAACRGEPGVHIFVTHDSLVTATVARMSGRELKEKDWPWCLEGAFFWEEGDSVHMVYREQEVMASRPLCGLSEHEVIEFARREIAATVGLETGARFFLAGGAFKSLLTGRAPRDLDLWASSARDRASLVSALRERGAKTLAPGPFADAFLIAGRVIEIPHKTAPATLSERLARFDIGLSAVGVEHRPDETWSALVHPLALESVQAREVRLLKPLVNWKYALTTLERMRRYAEELSYVVPEAEEAEIWRVFEALSPEQRGGLIERYQKTGSGAHGVMEEVACRYP